MTVRLDEFVDPGDGGDFALAWSRAMASAETDFVATPGATYSTHQKLDTGAKAFRLNGYSAKFSFGGVGGFVVNGQCEFLNVIAKRDGSSGGTLSDHGFEIHRSASFTHCIARNFRGDGFHISADKALGTNANHCFVLRCESTGHKGRGFSFAGGDANANLVVTCITSDCEGRLRGSRLGATRSGISRS